MKGKDICKHLREVRCAVASANDIDYTPAVCTHEGDCAGTCPACERELRYIERQLYRRKAMGKIVTVAGLALGAASFMPMQAQQVAPDIPAVQPVQAKLVDAAPGDTTAVIVRGRVIDRETGEPCVGVSIMLEGTKFGTATNLDGNFAMRVPKGGKLQFFYVGYEDYEYEVTESVDDVEIVITIDEKAVLMGDVAIIRPKMPDVDADIYEPR
ncbi:MAG: carboxypeptidase-like regulatory domain-containing protein [Muribaculaceae bacterium]|nr:carboxypeptidase-like regulatory domain-containing protein [Muribaculaceae bacterium]MBQ3961308.1 carboxypeptidase-like regulatory domain-containing protein [Muribaculaceae bacterium]